MTHATASPIDAIVFDWAGTIVDFGCFAPTQIFVEAFKEAFDFDISLAEARVPMGLSKWDHIQALGRLPAIAERWSTQFQRAMTSSDVDAIYERFMPLQKAKVAAFSDPILNAVDVVEQLKAKGIRIGSCSGYPRTVMSVLIEAAQQKGYSPECVVASDDLPQGGRPGPAMLFKNMLDLQVRSAARCVKVDDSVPGLDEGHAAGVWTVAVCLSGNEAGLTLAEFEAATPEALSTARETAKAKLARGCPHYYIDTINDLPSVLAEIEQRIERGERP